MAQPFSLDHLIEHVYQQAPDHALMRLSEAFRLAAYVNDQADNLIGHFVEQARRSGEPWSQIGAAMGVSKQAAQQRWVPRWGTSLITAGRTFGRFTDRARSVLIAANRLAGGAQATAIGPEHLAVAQYAEPEAIAAKVLGQLGVEEADLAAALDVTAEPADAVTDLPFDERAEAVLDAALREALRLQHNFIGPEHVLLGSLVTGDRTAEALVTRGVTTATVEPIVLAELDRILASRQP
jgi:Clp amino terminal domain, pathogenicity island component